MFKYHRPRPDQIPRFEAIRASAKALAYVIMANTNVTPDQTKAINKLREAVMFANASIALESSPNQKLEFGYSEVHMDGPERPAEETRAYRGDVRGGRPLRT